MFGTQRVCGYCHKCDKFARLGQRGDAGHTAGPSGVVNQVDNCPSRHPIHRHSRILYGNRTICISADGSGD
jgi:hypothetical protein